MFLYFAAYSIHYTVLPQLIVSKICSYKYNKTVCSNLKLARYKSEETHVYKDAATWNTLIFVCTIVPSLIFILPFGTLSDLISKKKLLSVPPVLMIVQAGVYLFSAAVPSSHLAFLMFGAICSGIFGDLQGAMALAYSYMSDMVKMGPVRTLRMAILGGLIYYGSGFAAYFAGLLQATGGFSSTFILSLVLSLVNLAYVVLLLPETDADHSEKACHCESEAAMEKERLTKRKESSGAVVSDEHATGTSNTEDSATRNKNYGLNEKSWSTLSANDFEANEHSNENTNRSMFFSSLWRYTKNSLLKLGAFAAKYRSSPRGKFILLLIAVYAFGSGAVQGESIIIVLFITHSPLSLSSQQVGTYLFILMVLRGSGAFVFAFLLNRFKAPDNIIIIIGFISFISTYVAMGFSTTKQVLYGFSGFSFLFTLTLSGVRSALTKWVDIDESGTVLCLCGFLGMAAESLLTVITSSLFRSTVQILPGLSIHCLGILSLTGLVIMLVFIRLEKRHKKSGYEALSAKKPSRNDS